MINKTAIVVCGIKNHIVLLEKLKARGYHTILVDGADRPIAYSAADEFVQIDIFDFEGIKELAVKRNADLIINACQEHLNSGICKISEQLGLPHPYSYEMGVAISNKEQMKKRMKEFGIPTTNYICVSAFDEIIGVDLKFPVYVKSCVGSGSNAVNRANSLEEVGIAMNKALSRYPSAHVIVEEEAKGFEYNVYCFPENGKANVLLSARRYTDNLSGDHVTKLIGTLTPPLISDKAKALIEETAQKIVDAFSLDNVPMFMQVMINGDELNVIEFAGRMAGGFGYPTILEVTGVDWFEATINAFLRIPNNLTYRRSEDCVSVSHVYGHAGVFGEFKNIEKLLENETIKYVSFPKLKGMEVKEGSANGSLVAYMIHKDPTMEGLLSKIKRTFDEIELLDINGKPMLNKELILTSELVLGR